MQKDCEQRDSENSAQRARTPHKHNICVYKIYIRLEIVTVYVLFSHNNGANTVDNK